MFLLEKAKEAAEKFCNDIETLGKDTERTAVALIGGDKLTLAELSERFGKRAAIAATVIALQKAGVKIADAVIDDDCIVDKIVEEILEPGFLETALAGTTVTMAAIAKVGSDEQLQRDLKSGVLTAAGIPLEVLRRIYHA